MEQTATIKPRVKVVTVTPIKAQRWLKRNKVNRRLRQKLVDKYAGDMRKGRWDLNGETLKFSSDNQLLDGQHRLFACVQSETEFDTAISYGLPESVMKNIDTGDKRSFSDRLKLEGLEKYSSQVAAITRLAYRYKVSENNTVSYDELAELFNKHARSLKDSIETVCPWVRAGDPPCLSATAIAFVHLLTKDKDRDKADNYAHQLVTGEGLNRKDPAHSIRAKLMRLRTDRMRVKAEDQIAMMLRGWNALRARRQHSRVYIMGKGDKGWKDIEIK